MEPFPDIEKLLPHRGTMLLLRDILAVEEDFAVAGATVSPNWPLSHSSGVDTLVLVELVAQAAAVAIGCRRLAKNEHSNREGWIVGVSQAQFEQDSIDFDTYVTITAHTDVTIQNYTKIKGLVAIDGRRIALIELQVFGMETQ